MGYKLCFVVSQDISLLPCNKVEHKQSFIVMNVLLAGTMEKPFEELELQEKREVCKRLKRT